MDIKELAIESADLYLQYLNDNKQDKGVQKYEITQIKRSENPNEKHIFYLELDKAPHMNDSLQIIIKDTFLLDPSDKEKELFKPIECDKKRKMIVVSVADRYLDVMMHAKPSDLTIISDMKFLIERVRNWYDSFGDDISFPLPGLTTVPFDNYESVTELSYEQKEAINGILANPFTYIWGAPGTGKTQVVLSNAVLSYIATGKKVLITAPTNSSLEQTLEGLLPVMKNAGYDYNKYVVRHGLASTKFAEKYPGVCENTTFETLRNKVKNTENIIKNIEQYQQTLRKQNSLLNFQSYVIKAVPILIQLAKEFQNLQSDNSHLQAKIVLFTNNKDSILSIKKEKTKAENSLIQKIDHYNHSLFKKLFINKINNLSELLDEIVNEIDGLDTSLSEKNKEIELLQESISNNNIASQNLQKQFETKKQELLDCCPQKQLGFLIQGLKIISAKNDFLNIETSISRNIKDVMQQKDNMRKTLPECKDDDFEVLLNRLKEELSFLHNKEEAITTTQVKKDKNNCLVFAITVDSFLARYQPDNTAFSHIFLDEAGYCPLVKGCTLFAYNCPVTLLGDHMQLPPVCEMPKYKIKGENWPVFLWAESAIHAESAVDRDLKELYNALYLTHKSLKWEKMKQYKLLTTYRFSDALAKALSDYGIYDKRFRGLPNAKTELYYIDAKRIEQSKERKNKNEVNAVCGYLKEHKTENIGIITPYNKQIKAIKEGIKTTNFSYENILTVHRSQSKEWDTVLFSVVDTWSHWFTDSVDNDSEGKYIINTAVSRAKKKLIIICDYDYWIGQKKQLISKLLENAEECII